MKKILGIVILVLLLSGNSYAEKNKEIKFLGNEINFLDQDTKTHIKKLQPMLKSFLTKIISTYNLKIRKLLKL